MNNGSAKHEVILRRLTERLGRIQRMFSEHAGSEFLNLTLNSIQSTVNKLSANFDNDQSNYLEVLLEEILLTNSEPVVSFEDRIEDVLWLLDFNSRPFFLYLIKRTSSRGQNEETIAGKLELLAFELKKVNQKVNDRSVRFTEKYPGLQDILSNWLTEEINFLRTKQRLVNSTAHPDKVVANDFKISLDLSVAQFSCLVRGLMEKKLILNTNVTELATFLSSSVVTKRSENISEGSFRRKYYDIEDSTKKSVIEVLNKTIDWLMKS